MWAACLLSIVNAFSTQQASADRVVLTTNAVCQPAWTRWWDINCINGHPATQQTLSSIARDAGGFNVGGGVSYRLNHLYHAKVFIEARYHRAYHADAQTSVIPITLGLRW